MPKTMFRAFQAALILASAAGLYAQLPITNPVILATPGEPSQTLYASRNGIFKSTDLGRTWNPLYLTEPGLPQPTPLFFVIDPTNDSNLFLATTASQGMFWKSSDAGATWSRANSGLPTSGADPVYLQFNASNRSLYLQVGNRLYKSTNNATSWSVQSTLPGSNSAFDLCGSSPSRMFYGQNEVLYRSDNEGQSWNAVASVIPTPSPIPAVRTGIGVVAVDANNCSLVFASLGGPDSTLIGIWRNTNAGEGSFTKVGGYVTHWYSSPAGAYYARSGSGGSIMRSTNLGLSWTNFPPTIALSAVDPKFGNILYGIGISAALIRSTDSGDTWSPIPATATPTLSKAAAPLTVTAELGGTTPVPLRVEAVETSTWSFPFTAATSGQPWLSLDSTAGTAPRTLITSFNPAGLTPGSYSATITLSAPSTANKSVEIPVRMTVVPRDEGRPDYVISTIGGAVDDISLPSLLALDNANNLLIAQSSRRVWRLPLSLSGPPVPFAGNGERGGAGDGGPATGAELNFITGLAVDASNNVYISESFDNRVRRVSNNTISIVIDRNTPVISSIPFTGAKQMAFDSSGRLLLAAGTRLLRFPPQSTSLEVIPTNFSPSMQRAEGVAVDPSGTIYLSDTSRHRILRLSAQGTPSVFAGTGTAGFSGDGGPATAAQLDSPEGIALDREGNLYIADKSNHRLRLITRDGIIRTIAGTGASSSNGGDGGPALAANLETPSSVVVDASGNIYVAAGFRVRKLARVSPSSPTLSGASNAGSGSPKVSRGGVFSVYGQNLAAATLVTSSATWPTTLGATSVAVNGVPAPIWFVSATQINAQLPFEVPIGQAQVAVTVSGVSSPSTSLQVVQAAPGLLACPSCGPNHALAINPDGSLNGPAHPAKPGDFVVVYLIGVGPTAGKVGTGTPSPTAPLPAASLAHSITLGGRPAEYIYLGLTPTFVALAQANVKIPDLLAGGHPLVITINGETSNSLNLSVRP